MRLTPLPALASILAIAACGGPATNMAPGPEAASGFPVSAAEMDRMFPARDAFYTYDGLTVAASLFPSFTTVGAAPVPRREAAAFLANVAHETGGLVYIEQIEKGDYCDGDSAAFPCAPGQRYYGRGPLQLSWNYNYGAAGLALSRPLLADPDLVARDAAASWETSVWYWMTQVGPGTMTPHDAILSGAGFGETIRSINGALECSGGYPAQVQDRVRYYLDFCRLLGVPPGEGLDC